MTKKIDKNSLEKMYIIITFNWKAWSWVTPSKKFWKKNIHAQFNIISLFNVEIICTCNYYSLLETGIIFS